jgi:MarR family transcriptional repressor of mepA
VISTESGKELCKKVEKHRVETDQTITQMLSKDETMGLVNVLKKMLEKEEN